MIMEDKSFLKASYLMVNQIAKFKRPDRIGEELIKPCVLKACEQILGIQAVQKLKKDVRFQWREPEEWVMLVMLSLPRKSLGGYFCILSLRKWVIEENGRSSPMKAFPLDSQAGGIIGPYFFKNDEGHNVTVNGDRYRATITNFFIPELNNHDVQELWFQQDGATCPTARATINLLKDTFGDRLISRFGPVNCPPRSCDLTTLDYFLWSYVKSSVYADKPQTLDHLEDNIRRVIADIRPQMLEKVIENWTSRLDYI
ncbi:DUF4817 domain-containing protein [Trichonephila clavipes]|nr:DUF4817 domain-containing protein [Trichonephila clavipes]